ncbi:hypothetical protein CBL_12103 [Carabus blaptoides fortunei]
MECLVDLVSAGPSQKATAPKSSSVDAGAKRRRTLENDGQGDERLAELRNIEAGASAAIDRVVRWGERVGVSVSWEKTSMMLMKGRLSARREPSVRVREWGVRYAREVKNLGVTMGERMNFKPHLREIRMKVARTIGCLRRVLRKEWGLGRRAVKVIYKGVFVACVTFAAGVWYDVCRYGNARDVISASQRLVLYACVRACRTVSTDAMRVLMGVWP